MLILNPTMLCMLINLQTCKKNTDFTHRLEISEIQDTDIDEIKS